MLVPTWMVDEGRVLFIMIYKLNFNLPLALVLSYSHIFNSSKGR